MEIHAKKSLGQNFLKDESVLEKIVTSCEIDNKDLIIEIGPGKGALTKKLKNFKCDLIAFEIDDRLKDVLSKLVDEKTLIVFNDFLKIDLKDYIKKEYNNIHIVANIPYYITNLIIRKLLDSQINFKDITLMVQKEVAERLAAKPGTKDYGALTVFVNLKYDVVKLFNVTKESFDPTPKVDSAIIRFQKKDKFYDIKNIEKFSILINKCFQNKRKTLKNNLKEYDWDTIYTILKKNGYGDMIRAEQLPIDVFVEISNKV